MLIIHSCFYFLQQCKQIESIAMTLLDSFTKWFEVLQDLYSLCNMLGQHRLESLRVSTDQLINLASILEDEESWHSANAELGGQVGELIDVKLDELDVVWKSLLFREPGVLLSVAHFAMVLYLLSHLLVEDGRDGLARTAPCSEAVDKNSLVCCRNKVLKLFRSIRSSQ